MNPFITVDFEVLVEGKPLRKYYHSGSGHTYVCMKSGDEYTLRVNNNNYFRRVLASLSVDGLSVMDGKTANWDRGGYVIGAHQYMDIPGFRLDNNQVAKFIAGAPGESYAALTDKPANIGVIGLAYFDEKEKYHQSRDYSNTPIGRLTRSRSAGGMHGSDVTYGDSYKGGKEEIELTSFDFDPGLGTKFGEATEHKVVEVAFERANSNPAGTLCLYYDTADNLRKLGILVEDDIKKPVAFPENQVSKGCTPPPGWKEKADPIGAK